MINFRDQVPSVYTSASRDFQYLGWLINIVLNSVKHNVDDLYDLPNTKADPRLTELLAMTLGFKVKRNYDQRQLATLVSIIPSLLKHKGTVKAVNLAGYALIKAAGVAGVFKSDLKNNCLEIQVPDELNDIVLFTDLLPYILPAGITTRVVTKTDLTPDEIDPIEIDYAAELIADWKPILGWDESTQAPIGLASLFEDSTFSSDSLGNTKNIPEFTNFKFTNFKQTGTKDLNAGLLDNSVIPDMSSALDDTAFDTFKKEE